MADIEQAASLAAPLEPLRGGKIKLHGRIEVDLDARLAALDAGSGYAYKAADIGDESRALYAVLCDPRVPYRQRPMAVLRGKNHKNHVSVVTAGRISPIGSKEMRLAVVLDRPKGVSLATLLSEGGSRGERWIADAVVPQAFAGLLALHRLGITHRALRPGNIFYNADDGTLVLGQCVTLPAGALQPPSLEPLESAAASPDGRGDGSPAYDAFALGALLLSLSVGVEASPSADDRAQLVDRLINGSFTALSGAHTVSGPFSDLLKGLMCDQPAARWGLEEIDAWVHGRRPRSKRVVMSRRAFRPFSFNGRDYLYDLELALDLAANGAKAAAAIGGPAFDEWLRTGLRDSETADNLAARLAEKPGRPRAADPVTEATIALDPLGPLRAGALAATPDGFGPALATAFAEADFARQNEIVDLIASDVPSEWMRLRRARAPRDQDVAAHVTTVQPYCQRDELGFGAERCLYELNKSLPCQSPLVAMGWVTDVPELMSALDKAAARSNGSPDLLDRHVAAFAASRSNAVEALLLRLAPAGSATDKRVVALEFFAEVQSRFNCGPSIGMAKAFAARFGPLADGVHSRTRRRKIKDHLAAAKGAGDLSAVLLAVKAVSEDKSDEKNFHRFVAHYAVLQAEIDDLKGDKGYAAEMGSVIGGRAAAALSLVFLALSVALAVFGIGL